MLRKLYICGLILSILVCGLTTMAQQKRNLTRDNDGRKRLALIIGNGNYVNARKLANPPNDAIDMGETLQGLGFEVISGTNLNLRQMTEKVREFGDKLKTSGGVGLFYYAGHGVQVNGRNYLIPVEADIPREDEIGFGAFNLDQVLRKMATANNGLNIVVLDACRNNPFARGWSRDTSDGGLAQITAPKGTFIAYATSPDMTASDGTGRNGLYTAELLKYLKHPNLKIEETFKEVTRAVDDKSGGKQSPWVSSSLRGEFIFNTNEKTASVIKPNLMENSAVTTQSLPFPQVENAPLPSRDEFIPMATVSILFDTGSAVLSSQGKTQLDQMVTKALSSRSYVFEIKGYADAIGSAEANAQLSRLRAQEVIDYLVVNQNIPLRRISNSYGMGENDPVGNSRTNEGRKQSRRVEVRILVRSGS